jgi:hypothetical protein
LVLIWVLNLTPSPRSSPLFPGIVSPAGERRAWTWFLPGVRVLYTPTAERWVAVSVISRLIIKEHLTQFNN